MKYLSKYKLFESKKEEDFFLACQDAFAEFIDDGAEFEAGYNATTDSPDKSSFYIYITIGPEKNEWDNFNDYYNSYKTTMDKIEDINVSIKRVKDEFQIDDSLNIEDSDNNNDPYIVLQLKLSENVVTGDFYKYFKNDNSVKIYFDALRKLLKLKKNVEIGIYTSGSNNYLRFNFPSTEELEQNQEALIRDFSSLEVMGEPINQPVSFGWSSSGDMIKKHEIRSNQTRSYHSARGRESETVNEITFGLSTKFQFDW